MGASDPSRFEATAASLPMLKVKTMMFGKMTVKVALARQTLGEKP